MCCRQQVKLLSQPHASQDIAFLLQILNKESCHKKRIKENMFNTKLLSCLLHTDACITKQVPGAHDMLHFISMDFPSEADKLNYCNHRTNVI